MKPFQRILFCAIMALFATACGDAVDRTEPSDEVPETPDEYTVYYVSSTATDDGGDGLSPAKAKQTIRAAIEAATAPAIVRVNAGTYNVTSDTTVTPTHIVLSEGISLYGGYTAKFDYRDPATYITTITDISTLVTWNFALPNSALEAGAGISIATIVDGFTINGSIQAVADYTAAIWVHDGGAPTVRNNTLNGGSGSNVSIGMHNDSSSPTVRNNTINGGSGGSYSLGMYNTSSSPTVRNNTLNGGSGDSSYGMSNSSSSPTVRNNILNGGSGGTSYGMYNNTSSPAVRNNTLNGGSGSSNSYGMYNASSSPTVRNNTLNGGSGGWNSYGMYNASSSSPTVRNNTINGGSGSGNSYGMRNSYSSPAIDNNIIFTSGAGIAYCIYESDTDSDPPASLRNNDLFSCSTALYMNYVDGTSCSSGDICITAIADVNALSDTTASGNIPDDAMFADIDGPDNDIDTMGDNDWHFSVSSPDSVTGGGLNGEDDGGWGFTTDKDGVTRPGIGLNWSMGAYEPSTLL